MVSKRDSLSFRVLVARYEIEGGCLREGAWDGSI